MKELLISCPKTINIDQFGNWQISNNPYENIINILGQDYIVDYLDNETKKNKGGNSIIYKLFDAQSFEENGNEAADLIIKISKFEIRKRVLNKKNLRFRNEINALYACNATYLQNVIHIFNHGKIEIKKKDSTGTLKLTKHFPFYTMDYAKKDLKIYMEENPNLSIFEKIDLCLQIAKGLNEINIKGFYHRDLKPDNIFIVENQWKIGDLGLVGSRKDDYNIDDPNELIGPRGWFCPEAMNKYLSENKLFPYRHDCQIDHQSDIFQLGNIFWYIFQGNAPIGTIKRVDFKIKDERIYEIIRRMINHSKNKRFEDIEDIVSLLKPVHRKYFITD